MTPSSPSVKKNAGGWRSKPPRLFRGECIICGGKSFDVSRKCGACLKDEGLTVDRFPWGTAAHFELPKEK